MNINTKNRIIAPAFGALYTVKTEENLDKIDDITDLEKKYSYQREGISSYTEMPEDNCGPIHSKTCFVGDDYSADDKIETMLINKGIKFKRTTFGELVCSPDSIKERVVLSPEEKESGLKLVEVDRTEFDTKYEFYGFGYVGNKMTGMCQPEKTEKFENYLKTGKKIYAPVVSVNDEGNHPEIIFGDGRHRYAYMRDIKMKGIPVAMDEDSIKVAKKFGLLAQ